jgi:2-keto-4-pentenoate hydratase/2-oxohepta-3-ene-1,7-dioic acid hydratase in catechol pathway
VRGKSLDTFLPVGDLVPASEVPDPQALPIRAILNGETMQDSNTSNQIFGVAEVISFVTQAITLEPGDLIITGTPAGVGAFRKPPVWLQPGDEITIEIDGLGSITNPVVAA